MSNVITADLTHKRNYSNLRKKFLQYLIPATITELATSLNEFVDSLMVANLLDESALSVVNIAGIVVFIFSTVYSVLGIGGSAMYSISLGNHERDKSDSIFTASIVSAAVLSVVMMAAGIIFAPQLAQLIGKGSGVETELASYIKVLSCSSIPIIISCTFVFFLPGSGHPVLATVTNIVSNVVNLIFDIIYIKWFDMGVNGAALATVTGFSVGMITVLVAYLLKKDSIAKIRFSGFFKNLKGIFTIGISSAATQIGYAIKISFCNLTAASYCGENGVLAFTVCFQILSIISIFLGGILSTIVPFSGTLKGTNDKEGLKYIMRLSSVILLSISILFFLVLEIWPELLLNIYSITSPDAVAIAIPAIRIFSWLLLFRWLYMEFRTLISVLGMKIYALVISLLDGFVLVIVCALILCPVLEIEGLWWALLISTVLIAVGVFIANKIIAARSNGKYKGFWLIADNGVTIADFTVDNDLSNIGSITKNIETVCREKDLMLSRAMLAAISVEEMSVIVRENAADGKKQPIDVLIQSNDTEIIINFCSVGLPFNSTSHSDCDSLTSFEMLKRISKSVNYDYVMGMNVTRITISK